ncbi:MAG: hypothetical protein A2138_13470 [Deltaproteobacteria bacterium RBG_16_71_12]|nr:MAG: hypothetical protein A2138_13470 [Deltaproteobacteria bacterium RBG_16_71_12]
MRVARLALLVAAFSLAAACAGPNIAAAPDGAGFWRGLAHGFIAPVTFVVSLFREDVSIYEVKNNGGFYDAGFLIGIGCWGGGGAAASRRRRGHDRSSSKVKPPSPA